ncbi:non-ribosomal peptide synthetase [Rhodococcus sp. 1163]|uniref:non-ribosomal peptide synthetase n=1 Tax=Rhodococcus sp. 1163 TaxID=1905289 RepID=UPI0009FEAF4C|nr:non-ribosomal peptide synthetase [Rhodococcus sp. 1163]
MDSVESLEVRSDESDRASAADAAPFPLTAAQKGLWFAQHLMPEVPITIANYLDIRGTVDIEMMLYAVRRTVRELGAGSLRLVEIDGEPQQYVDAAQSEDTVRLDFSDSADPEQSALDWMQAAYCEPIDLVGGPLTRLAIIRISPDRIFWYSHSHHIALDGFGAVQLINRAAEIYSAVVEGQDPSPSKAGALVDIYGAEAAYRASPRFGKDRQYWMDKTRDMPAPASPAGMAAPPSSRSRICGEPLPEMLEVALARTADRLDSAFAPIAVAAVAAFLSALTGAEDIVLSLPVAGRTTALLRRSGGMVSNVLPIRVRIGSDTTVAGLVADVQLELTGALRHQRYRAEDIRRDADMPREQRGFFGPAINIMAYDEKVQLGSVTGLFNVLSTGPVEDLSVNLYPAIGGGRSRIDFEANPNVYSEQAFRDLHNRFLGLLAQFLGSEPSAPVIGFDILDVEEVRALVPARGPAAAAPASMPDILAAGTARNRDGIALIAGAQTLTYRELDLSSNALARALIARGAGPDTVVAVSFPRSIDSVLAFWAVAKSGASFVPIDPTYPRERIAHMVGESGVLIGLSARSLAASLPDSVHWLTLDDKTLTEELAERSSAPITDADRRCALDLDHAAYTIYTSGSTGTPKGVLVTHRGLSAFTTAERPELGLTPASRVLRFSSSSFDASIFEMIAAFSAGATMVIAPPEVYGGRDLTQLMTEHAVTHIITAPALLSTVAVEEVASLESVVVGGDVCPPDLVERLAGVADLRNSYGPTESTIVITMTEPQHDPHSITIGRPLQGASAVVLDRWLRPVPSGASGELYVGGPGLARGYHRRFDLTAERFVADPFGSGTRLYRTGDVVRWRGDDVAGAELEFVGRSDFQVQLHGLRIELGEVDAVLAWHASTDFVVSTIFRHGGQSQLVSYVKIKPDHTFDRESLLALASDFLPTQMIPVHLIELEAVPLTATGKVDRSALPDPIDTGTTTAFRAASGPVELAIAESMASVLGLDSIGVDDSFFALGGDSIVAIQLVSRAKESGVIFTPRDVFERRTVAALAEVAANTADRIQLAELDGGGVGPMPLLPIARSVCARAAEPADLDSFYQALVLTSPPDLDPTRLRRTVAAILDQHDMLRARWVGENLVVGAPGTVSPESVISHETVGAETQLASAIEDSARRASRRLRPRDGVMLQLVSVVGDGWARLVIVAHHLVIDGVSWRILVPDLASAWSQSDDAITLAPTGTSMRRWTHGLAELDFTQEREKWMSILDGDDIPIGSRPLDPKRDTGTSTRTVQLDIDADVTAAVLGPLTTAYRMGPEDALLTALALAFHRWRGTSQLVSIESHGRDEELLPGADLTRTVGWFTTVHPVRLWVHDATDPAAAVKAVKEQLRSIPARGTGYGSLRAAGALDGLPAPQISFNYLGRVADTPDALIGVGWIPDMTAEVHGGSGEDLTTDVVLDINVVLAGKRLSTRIGYPDGVLTEAEVREFATLWAVALGELSAHANDPSAGGLTPADVALVQVDQHRIELWEDSFGRIDDVWPLAPLQRGLMFHADLTRDSVDVYAAQIMFELDGDIDGPRLRRAAQRLLDRHDNLRAAFVHDARGLPVQVILADVDVPWREETVTDPERIIAEERLRRFDMAAAPLVRFALLRSAGRTQLVVTNHHILFDGWSMPIFIKDLLVLYGTDAPIPTPARAYRDYLEWLSRRDHDAARERWVTALEGLDEPTLLAPATSSADGTSVLPREVSVRVHRDALAALAKDASVTVNTVVQVAWSIVLSSLLTRSDVVFGATVSGRPAEVPGATDTLGLFINTLPVRVRSSASDSVRTVMTRLQNEQVELLDVHHVGLADIQGAAGPGAMFDTLTVFESYPIDRSALRSDTDIDGMRVLDIAVEDATHYPLTLVTVLEPDLTMTLRFSSDAFSPGQVTTMTERLQRVLTAMTNRPDGALIDIDVLGELEREALTLDWNATDREIEPPTLTDLLSAASSTYASETCVVFEEHSLTYGSFAARVHCLARFLLSRGVGPESVVAVALPRSIDQLVAIHAVVHAGAAYLPLDPTLPGTRIAYMVDTCSPASILGSHIEATAPVIDPRTLDLSRFGTGPIAPWERKSGPRGGNTAYVIFTSGSTGMPKGVAVSHASIVNRLLWMQDTYPLDESDVVLHKTPTTFDVSVWELFWPHLTGARTVIAEPEGHRDPKYLSGLVQEQGITTAHFVPSMLDLFLEYGDTAACTSLRHVFASGEALQRSTVRRFHAALDTSLHNLYGPTEAAVDVTFHDTEPGGDSLVPIGVPVWNTQLRVLDPVLRLVPIGAVGELYLAGAQLARGYLGRAALTSERFVPDPFGSGTRLYRTGDLVRWTLDGELEYLGRNDFQVKLRGQRLELGDIEASILRTPGVASTVVTVHGSGADHVSHSAGSTPNETLVAYVSGTASIEEIRSRAEAELPAYMVPTVYVPLTRMPLGRNGKLDRSALPEPVGDSAEVIAPADDTEAAVAAIFADVLGRSDVGVTIGWFELGGNSLTATQVVARVNSELGSNIGVRALFDHPTVRALSAQLAHGQSGPALRAAVRPESIPLAPNQHRMWLLNRFDPASGAYNIAGAIRLTGDLDTDALRQAVFDVVERHEALRTVYPDSPDGPRQVVLESAALEVPTTDTTERDLAGALAIMAARGFDVTAQPPIRAAVLRLGPTEHVLMVITHHIAADGWSMRPLARDVMAAYTSRTHGTAPTWTPLAIQYADYALWKIEVLGSESDPDSTISQQLAFWKNELRGVPERLPLPTDRPHPAAASHRGATAEFTVTDDTRRSVTALAQRTGTTPFMVLHAALTVLLARVSGERDITVGTPVAGRGEEALDEMVGMFVGTLTLRTEIDLASSFTELLHRVRDRDLAAYSNADVPFDRLVEVLAPTRSTAHHPLFQVMLSVDDSAPTVELPGLVVAPVTGVAAVAKFDLQLEIDPVDFHGTFTYATDLFDASTIASFARHFVNILATATADPDAVVGDIDLADPTVLQGSPALRRRTLPQLLASAVVNSTGAAALEDGDIVWTYPELDDASTRIARQLIARGAGPESSVAIMMARSATAVLMLWAVAKTGAAFVPIDPRYPAGRIEHMLTDSGAQLGIGEPGVGSVHWVRPSELDPSVGSAAPITDADRILTLRPEHRAYIIYTSGSTGTPKGVAVTHNGLANFSAELCERLRLDNGSRTFHFASASFDASILEMLLPLGTGCTMVIAGPDIYGGAELTRALRGVTHAFVTPAALATVDPDALPELSTVVVGGEASGTELVRTWAGRVAMFNAYGPTEATIAATIDGPLDPELRFGIGGPIRGVSAYVLDSRLHPVPSGVIGELYVGGDSLARGYHGKVGTTAASFVADPFSRRGTRLYRTGDRVRSLGGSFEFLGRADAQVKVRGFRIELGEIDAVLTRHPDVDNAVSDVDSDAVVSYVVPAVGRSPVPADLLEHARRTLPSHMVPRSVTIIESIPVTAAGKLDRSALPAPVKVEREFLAPRTDSEILVAEVFATVFDLDRVGADEDFFDLGGNSLVATRVVGRINERAGTSLPVRSLFDSPTVAGIAVALDTADRSQLPVLTAGPRPRRIPLSAAQSRMWLLNRADPDSAAYNIALAVRLTGTLDAAALTLAVQDVLGRHESLRTTYPGGYEPEQVILEADAVGLDLTPVDVEEHAVLAETAKVLGRGFDVTAGVPLRGSLLRTRADEYVLLLVVHHIAADGVSMIPLTRDILTAYTARLHGAPAPWSPLPAQYADYALWQHSVLGSTEDPDSVASRQLDYWRTTLDGLPDLLDLPSDRRRPAVASQRGDQVTFELDDRTFAAARSLAHRHGASTFMVMNAAYAILLARLSGTSDIAVGTTVSGRGAGMLDDVVGMFVGTLVLRNEVRPSASFTELLAEVRERNLDAFANADIPFEKVVEALRPTRSTSHSPLFQALLAYEHERPSTIDLPGLTVSKFPYEPGVTRFDLALTLSETDQGLSGALRYSTDLFDADTVAGFAARFEMILGAAVAEPSRPVGDIDILDAAERSALAPVHGAHAPTPCTFSELIASAVSQNPDGVAVRWRGRDYTYADADAASTQLARVLLGYGIGPETVVALGLPRSVESVLAVWAVTKTGAAYVPVDPAYPADRLEHMVTDSGAVMGITLAEHVSALPTGITWLELDSEEQVAEQESAPKTSIGATESNGYVDLDTAAYMIYTSGSTGMPKGVVVSHRGIANLAASRRELHRVQSSSRFLHNTSPSFDMAVGEMVSALSAAAILVISPPEILGGDELTDFLRAERVTHALMTPSALSTLDPENLTDLEVVCVGGEACSPELVSRWAPGRLMLNGYGPTEATDISTLGPVENGSPIDIGAPITGFEAVVLDTRLHPVPVGVPGELYVAGPALARGYHGRPGLSSERFVAHPFGHGRMYRTGDIVRWTAAGTLRYSGRLDHQVKVRGFRVELGEIDAALSTHPGVDFAVTLGRPGPSGDTALVSYVLVTQDGLADHDVLRSHVRALLPGYMIPAAVMVLTTIPRTPTGKLDVDALPEPDFSGLRSAYRPPATATEATVVRSFSEVLKVDDVSVTDNFFELGGTSLSAMRMLTVLRESTGTTLSLQSLLADPVPESLASLLDSGADVGSSFDVVFPIREGGPKAVLFCIHPIIGLSWCYAGLDKYTDGPIYGIQTPGLTDLPGSLDDLAQRYIEEIERIAPDGPYHLLGWSLGGTIAHAIAVVLRASGKEVHSLIMLDAHAVAPEDVWDTDMAASDLMHAVGVAVPGIDDQRISLDSLPDLVSGSGVLSRDEVERLLGSARHNHDISTRHHPGVYDGEVLYVAAGHEERQGLATWHPYIRGEITTVSIPNTHWQMTSEAALKSIGSLIDHYIRRGVQR